MMTNVVLALALVTCLGYVHGQVLVYTDHGPVRGQTTTADGKSIDEFLSIPFAEPPNGTLRFQPPKPPRSWTEPLDVTKPSAACVQYNLTLDPSDIRYHGQRFSEDCLYLNVWRPSHAGPNKNLPVMVWIYGGGLQIGLKDIPLYNGAYLAGYDVVVVSMNYRLGLLGFGFVNNDTTPGNVGLLDQLEALKWVRNNIKEFGGDPNQVTIFGESAGAWSVGLHLLSPLSQGYFKKVIMQSGAPIEKLYQVVYTQEQANQNAKTFAKYLNCPVNSNWNIYNCFMKATIKDITDASTRFMFLGGDFMPVVDKHFLPDYPLVLLDRGHFSDSKMLIGATKDEFTSFMAAFIDPFTLKTYETNQIMSFDYLSTLLRYNLKINDDTKITALRKFYESMMYGADVMEVANRIGTDAMFVCAMNYFASKVSQKNDVYFYQLNYPVSSLAFLPEWMGVVHSFDLELVFGHPYNTSRSFSVNDRIMSQSMMTYWTNFAKTGNPNFPLRVTTNWPRFETENLTYIEFDTAIATREGHKRHECAFVNKIMPFVSGNEATKPPRCSFPRTSGSRSLHQNLPFVTVVTALVLLVILPLRK